MAPVWRPGSPSRFDDLVEAPRWHQYPIVFAVLCWGTALSALGLILCALIGRDMPTAAWTVPGVLAALAGVVRGFGEGSSREKAREGPAP
jgi:hypothetical protein